MTKVHCISSLEELSKYIPHINIHSSVVFLCSTPRSLCIYQVLCSNLNEDRLRFVRTTVGTREMMAAYCMHRWAETSRGTGARCCAQSSPRMCYGNKYRKHAYTYSEYSEMHVCARTRCVSRVTLMYAVQSTLCEEYELYRIWRNASH